MSSRTDLRELAGRQTFSLYAAKIWLYQPVLGVGSYSEDVHQAIQRLSSEKRVQVPAYIEGDVNWAVIMDIKGQKARVAGYIIDSVFYILFLDKEHLFYKMKDR